MLTPFPMTSLLVPVDFSTASAYAADRAFNLVSGDSPVVILIHVIDPALVELAVTHGWGTAEQVTATMRQHAEQKLEQYRHRAPDGVAVDGLVVVGIPFVEILHKADDFAVDAIVVGKASGRAAVEKLMFGSTAEKLLRASHHPVLVLPVSE